MLVCFQASTERTQTEMAQSGVPPSDDAILPFRLPRPDHGDPGFRTDGRAIPACLPCLIAYFFYRLEVIVRCAGNKPPVGLPAQPPDHSWHGRRGSPDPNRDGALHGQRIDPGTLHRVPSAFELHRLLTPQHPQKFDLFLTSCTPGFKVLPHREIFIGIVANTKGFTNSPGGGHSHGITNIGGLQQGAAASPGARLAWGEGVATFLGLMAIQDGNLNAAIGGLPMQDRDTNYDSYASTSSAWKPFPDARG